MTRSTRAVGASLVCVLALALLPVALSSGPAGAQPRQAEIDAEVDRLRKEISESELAEARVLAELRVSQRARRDLDARVVVLDAALVEHTKALGDVGARVIAASAAHDAAAARTATARSALAASEATLRSQAIHAYVRMGTGKSLPEIIASVEDVNEGPRVVALFEAASAAQSRVIDTYRAQREALSEAERSADGAKAAVMAEQVAMEAQRSSLAADRAELARLRGQAQTEVVNEERLLAKLQQERTADEVRLATLQAESTSIAGILRQRQAGQPQARATRGTIGYPVSSAVVTSRYGWRTHPIFGGRRLHAGIDLRGATGTPVLAAADGVVVFAGFQSGYGNVVVLDHGRALATLYAHQSRMGVSVGQSVRRGQVIGSVGATGYATGPHLHFELRVSGAPVDPMPWL